MIDTAIPLWHPARKAAELRTVFLLDDAAATLAELPPPELLRRWAAVADWSIGTELLDFDIAHLCNLLLAREVEETEAYLHAYRDGLTRAAPPLALFIHSTLAFLAPGERPLTAALTRELFRAAARELGLGVLPLPAGPVTIGEMILDAAGVSAASNDNDLPRTYLSPVRARREHSLDPFDALDRYHGAPGELDAEGPDWADEPPLDPDDPPIPPPRTA